MSAPEDTTPDATEELLRLKAELIRLRRDIAWIKRELERIRLLVP